MLTSCDKCGKQYRINLSDIKGQSARFKCKDCGNILAVKKPFSQEGSANPNPVSPDFQERPQSFPSPPPPPAPAKVEKDFVTQNVDTIVSAGASVGRPEQTKTFSGTVSDSKLEISGMSLKTKITTIMVVFVFISLAIVGVIASYQSHNALSSQAESHLLRTATQKSNEYEQIFVRIKEELEGMAAYTALVLDPSNTADGMSYDLIVYGKTGPAEGDELKRLERQYKDEIDKVNSIGPVLHSVVSNNPYLSLGYVSTDTSITLFDSLEVLEIIRGVKQFHPHKRPWFIEAKENEKTIWTDLYVDVATGELTVTCATPVFLKDEKFKGVVGFDVLLKTIKDDILRLNIGYNSYAFLVNKAGKVLVKPELEKGQLRWDSTVEAENWLETDNEQFNNIIKSMIEMKQGVGTYMSDEGERYIAYAPIKAMDVSMGIVAFKGEVVKPATDMRNLIIVALGVVLLFTILIGIMLGNAITKPINRLTLMADLMSQGQMDLDVLKEDRKDEIGVLTKSFNRLIISLKMALSR